MTYPALTRAPMGSADFRLAVLDKAPIGPVGILWDMENCPIPGDVHSDEVARNIRMALRVHPGVQGFVTNFSAYGDFNQFPRRLREGCQRTGINLIDVPNGPKDASDKAILADMFLFALDNPPPCTILLITGDVDFAPALHKLGQRGYTVLLAVPASRAVASSLCNASRYVWDWPSVARGEGIVPAKALRNKRTHSKASPDCPLGEDADDGMVEDPCILTTRRSFGNGFSRESKNRTVRITTHMHTGARHKHILNAEDNFDELWAQPGDIEGLKNQLIKLLKSHGGVLNFTRVSAEYKRFYGRPLFLSEYGSLKLVNLLRRMGNGFKLVNAGSTKMLVLQECLPTTTQALSQVEESARYRQQGGSLDNLMEQDDDLVEEIILLRAKD